MRRKIVNILKYNRVIYFCYYYIMSTIISALKLFVKPDSKMLLFNSFAGRKYDDSPKAIFEYMKKDRRFEGYRFFWAFHEPERYKIEGTEIIKTDGIRYFLVALKARVWITNSSVERGLKFKGKQTIYLNTWHGSPVKKMGTDIPTNNKSFHAKGTSKVDIMNTQSQFEEEIFSRCFDIPKKCFIEVGLPRNDELTCYTEEYRKMLRKRLQILDNKRILLYCPTFREFEKDGNNGIVLAPPMQLEKWKRELGDDYILLFRAHYEVAKAMTIHDCEFVRDVTMYPSLNDLMIMSDVLISDYSSIFFDYSIMDKPMLHFAYDYDRYEKERGMYFDIRNYINGAATEEELIKIIKNLDFSVEIEKTRVFRNKFMNYYGHATSQTVDAIYKMIKGD